MTKLAATLTLSLGLGILAGGGFAFVFGLHTVEPIEVRGMGPFDRLWNPADFCFLGTVLAGVGSGLFTYGLAWFLLLFRHGRDIVPRGSTIIWALTLAVGIGGIGVAVGLWRSTEQALTATGFTQQEAQQIGKVLAVYSTSDDQRLLTKDFARRLQGQKEVVAYKGQFTFQSLPFGANGAICSGHAMASGRMTRNNAGGAAMLTNVDFPVPLRIAFSMRVLRNAEGNWRIDDLRFAE